MQGTHLRPQRRLGLGEESADLGREEGALDIPFGSGAALPAAQDRGAWPSTWASKDCSLVWVFMEEGVGRQQCPDQQKLGLRLHS